MNLLSSSGPDGERELSATCACVDRANVERLPNLLPISFPKITRAIQAHVHNRARTPRSREQACIIFRCDSLSPARPLPI